MNIKLTVSYEEPNWVGIFERDEDGKTEVSKITFDTEPQEQDVYKLILKRFEKSLAGCGSPGNVV